MGLLACSHTTNFDTGREATDGGLDAQSEEDAAAIDADVDTADGGQDAQSEDDAGPIDAGLAQDEAGQALCGTHVCACSNGLDDDGDEQRDGFDNECTGPFDDDEGTFRMNDVREQSTPKCTDCFFDGNAGASDDRCNVASSCTFEGTPGNGGGNCRVCTATTECVDRCTLVTPNGCDCFGCCEVLSAGAPVPIRLVSTCRMDVLSNTRLCPRCIINTSCRNPCETCEICPGRTLADLPLSCMNAVACGERKRCTTPRECDFSEYCSQGCCVPILL